MKQSSIKNESAKIAVKETIAEISLSMSEFIHGKFPELIPEISRCINEETNSALKVADLITLQRLLSSVRNSSKYQKVYVE